MGRKRKPAGPHGAYTIELTTHDGSRMEMRSPEAAPGFIAAVVSLWWLWPRPDDSSSLVKLPDTLGDEAHVARRRALIEELAGLCAEDRIELSKKEGG